MTVNQLVVAAGANLKWMQNASAILRRDLRPNKREAKLWALIRLLSASLGLPLKLAQEFALKALDLHRYGVEIVLTSGSEVASIVIDLTRFESAFEANLSRAFLHETPRRRGRPKKKRGSAVERAREWGIDISLLQSHLQDSVSERLEQLSENSEAIQELRMRAR